MRLIADYDLGRARGRVEITADTDQAQRALRDYDDATQRATRSSREFSRVEQELTNRRSAADAAARRRTDAEANYRRIMADTTSTIEEQVEAEQERNRARGEHLQATRRATEAERAYNAALAGNTDAVRRFTNSLDDMGQSQDRATRRMRDFRQEIVQTELAARVLARTVSQTLGLALKSVSIGAGAGILGGLLGLGVAGAGQGGILLIGGLAQAIAQLSGAIALLPAAAGGAIGVMGTLAVSFRGVGDALEAAMANDPKKFAEAIKDMGPAARSVVTQLASFTASFKGAMQAVQESFMQPLVDQISPLVQTWLPALMQAGQQIGGVLGNLGRSMAQWLQQPQVMAAFQNFITNLSASLQALQPAFTAFANAMTTLGVVGGQFLPQIADAIARAATNFNELVQTAAQTGRLQNWIQSALDGFGNLVDIVKNVGVALANIGSIQGGNFLGWLAQVSAEFRAWTESAEGATSIAHFFDTMSRAGETLMPILRIIGGTISDLFYNLAELGISLGPGFMSFFQSLRDALNVLGQSLIASGPALNQILSSLGDILLRVVQEIGPQLPTIFANFGQALVQLTPMIVSIAGALADMLANLTPTQITWIIGIVTAFKALGTIVPIVQLLVPAIKGLGVALSFLAANPVVLVIAAVAALAVGLIYLYNTNEDFRNAVKDLWADLQGFAAWVGQSFMNIIRGIGEWFTNVGNSIRDTWNNLVSEAQQWGVNLIQGIINGIYQMTAPIREAAGWLAEQFAKFWPRSPAQDGPFRQTPPEALGANVASGVAAGIESGGPGVASAGGSLAGSFGTGFGSTGAATSVNPNFGGGTSGMNQFVNQITKDLQAWLSIVRNSFGLFEKVANLMANTTKVVASLWGGGDNPLTRPGGPFSELPAPLPAQQFIPGVEQLTPPGEAPMPELTPQGHQEPGTAPVTPQQNVPGVPQTGPVTPAPAPPAAPAPAPPGPGSAPPPAQPGAGTYGVVEPEWVQGDQTIISYGSKTDVKGGPGFPDWVYQVADKFGLEASTYGGHQTSERSDIGAAPNPQGLNRGIDWRPKGVAVDSAEGAARLDAFAKFLQQAGMSEMVIWENPVTGEQFGYPQNVDYSGNYPGHRDHLHSRHSRPIVLEGVGQPPAAPAPGTGGPARGPYPRNQFPTPPPPTAANPPPPVTDVRTPGNRPAPQGVPPGWRNVARIAPDQLPMLVPNNAPALDDYERAPAGWYWEKDDPYAPKRADGSPAWVLTPNGMGPGSDFYNKQHGLPIGSSLEDAKSAAATGQMAPNPQTGLTDAEATAILEGRAPPSALPQGVPTPGAPPPGAPPPAGPGRAMPSGPLLPITTFPVQGLGPGSTPYSGRRAPGTRGGATTPDEIKQSIIAEGRARGYSDDQIVAALTIASQETGFWSNRNTPTQGPAGVVAGVYQQSTTSGWGTSEQILDPAYAITRFYDVYGANIAANPEMSPLQAAIITQNPSFYTQPRSYPYDRDTMANLEEGRAAFQKFGNVPGAPPPQQTPSTPPPPPAPPATPTPPGMPTTTGPSASDPYRNNTSDDWMLVPDGWDINVPIPKDVVAKNLGISVEEANLLPPMYYAARPGSSTNIYIPPGTPVPHGATPTPMPGVYTTPMPGPQPGFTETQQPALPFGAKTPMGAFQSGMQAVGSVASDAMAVFDNVIKSIGATANIMDMLVRGPSSTEDVMALIDNYQQYLKTAASVAKLVGTIGGVVAGAGQGDPTGMTGAAGSAVQAIAGLVQSAIEATDMAIDLGQEVWHQVSKYAAIFAGNILGGDVGFLGGNVRMLLNTATGEVYAYSEDNPLNKATHNMPDWMARSYGGTRPELQPPRVAQVNIYAGPGQTPRDMMNESMWLVNNSGAAASIAGAE